ncbi:hypothetical protein NMYAN_30065 [Nitrosomonas nitrosa]|uniref:Uncharacterized protein n=1 Tax=Nitrosomonas nitrosa TaxID=52442 RepID=A0A8H9DBR6_9PROT|nr:hypothetical protein NMYAN_30065 [Nitrosomonas nitrosa]
MRTEKGLNLASYNKQQKLTL